MLPNDSTIYWSDGHPTGYNCESERLSVLCTKETGCLSLLHFKEHKSQMCYDQHVCLHCVVVNTQRTQTKSSVRLRNALAAVLER